MRFDDRLATVLHQPVRDAHDRAVRWRQLIDLVARAGAHEHSATVAEALELIRSEAEHVPEQLRAAAARAIAGPSLPLELLRYFAAERLSVAAPLLAAVQLDDEQWRQLAAGADPEVRRFIQTLRPELETRSDQAPPAPPAPAMVNQPLDRAIPSISDVVARIERLRHAHEQEPVRSGGAAGGPRAGPAAPPDSPPLFRWECDPSGEIEWVEGAPRGALVGRSIARREGDEGVDEQVERAFAVRAPFRDASLQVAGEGPVAGEWKISGIPAFSDGRFAGYRGVAVRELARAPDKIPGTRPPTDPDALRELVHELKTPLNAIIGFAEIIDGQFLGPADRRYRERAIEIVEQAQLLLAAIDDLDFTASLQASREGRGTGAELGSLLHSIVAELREQAADRGAEIQLKGASTAAHCTLSAALAERLVRRFCASLVGRAGRGEHLDIRVDRRGSACRIAITEPHAFQRLQDVAVPASDFELRLVRGLARIVGGEVSLEGGSVVLSLPAA